LLRLLSYFIDEDTPIYGGKSGFLPKPVSLISKGDSANTSYLQFPNHLGTHIDFPNHFYENGQTIEDFSLDFWIYYKEDIQFIEVNLHDGELLITPNHIECNESINKNAKIVLLKTGAYEYRMDEEKYWKYNPGIGVELAEWLRQNFQELRLIGIDSISISSWQHRQIGRKVHKLLLKPAKPILLIEDMDLSKVNKNTIFKEIIIAPLMVKDSNGSPCTIFAEVKK